MRIALYCPLKSPNHPNPSGDRRMARLLQSLLSLMGHKVELASELRSLNKTGDPLKQAEIALEADREIARLTELWSSDPSSRPDLWVTYHNYHKAPDLLSAGLCQRFQVPCIIIEPSISPKRAEGPWAQGYQAALDAMLNADRLMPMTDRDEQGLLGQPRFAKKISRFPPFLDVLGRTIAPIPSKQALARRFDLDPARPWLITVAMMRPDVKQQSYGLLIKALETIKDLDWQWLVVGYGDAREAIKIEATSAGLLLEDNPKQSRARFLDVHGDADIQILSLASSIFVWPALNEAYGMALLESQAAGLPAIVFDEGGVKSVMQDGLTGVVVAQRNVEAFAQAIKDLLADTPRRNHFARMARSRALSHHSLRSALSRFKTVFAEIGVQA